MILKRIIFIWLPAILASFSVQGQYITEVIEYVPAPGQYINTAWGSPYSARSIAGGVNGGVSLGAFGGYLVFRFDAPVANDPDNPYGVDFTIFGNPQQEWSEPGIVSVMKDENQNGLADDTWYELAGSEHFFSTTLHDYKVTYRYPGTTEAADVSWFDNMGNQGWIRAIENHLHPYYPLADSFDVGKLQEYALSGTMIRVIPDFSNPVWIKSERKAFGYADNQLRGGDPEGLPDNPYTPEVEGSGGDAFDISWAVDADGTYVDLDEISFVRIHNATLADAGPLGEISTEVTGAVDVSPAEVQASPSRILVLNQLPDTIQTDTFQLEVAWFLDGRIQSLPGLDWSTDHKRFHVDDKHRLVADLSGAGQINTTVKITCSVASQPQFRDSLQTIVQIPFETGKDQFHRKKFKLYPNPAINWLNIVMDTEGAGNMTLQVFNLYGKKVLEKTVSLPLARLEVGSLEHGMYVLVMQSEDGRLTSTFIKE